MPKVSALAPNLVENYQKTHLGRQYAVAHQRAIEAEQALRAQRPSLARFAFGAGPYLKKAVR